MCSKHIFTKYKYKLYLYHYSIISKQEFLPDNFDFKSKNQENEGSYS